MAAEAGLVPWAESGTRILVRPASPRSRWYFFTISRAVNSPWAPAAGWKVMAPMPVISHSSSSARRRTFRQPWTVSGLWLGWTPVKPGRAASSSWSLGLYFMVQEPRG